MTLPAPHLDDRRFQDLVDDAKRYVQQRCPEWSDHNVSDPGVTLIETFAMMVDQLIYRLNRVPDRLYVRFLELLGITLTPPSAAKVDVTFWLSAPREEPVMIPALTEVATPRTGAEDPVVFSTTADLAIVPCALAAVATTRAGETPVDRGEQLSLREPFPAFSPEPRPGDALLLGLSTAVPGCVVALRFGLGVEGVGVVPERPPLVWEAWDGRGWQACELERDETGGLNKPGDMVIHVPPGHKASVVAQHHAGWLRCRVVPPAQDQPFYTASPRIRTASAFTIGGTVTAEYAETVQDEVLGVSEGVPGQRFRLARRPVVAGKDLVVEVAGGAGWERWTRVEHFTQDAGAQQHFVLDPVAGEIVFGPGVRLPDGTVRQYGAVPPKGAPVRVPSYRVGGGRRGNVPRGAVNALRSSLPYVARVENRRPASGGADAEDLDSVKLRAPSLLRSHQDRAVTAADYEYLARAATPAVARVRCVPAGAGEDPAIVRVLVVPVVESDEQGQVDPDHLRPGAELLETVTRHLDERRVLGTRLVVEPPAYVDVTVAAWFTARPGTDRDRLGEAALAALYRYLHPLDGGPDGTGWPFGRPVQTGEFYTVLQRLPEVELVQEVRLFQADPVTRRRSEATTRIELGPNALPLSFRHDVKVSAT